MNERTTYIIIVIVVTDVHIYVLTTGDPQLSLIRVLNQLLSVAESPFPSFAQENFQNRLQHVYKFKLVHQKRTRA